MQRDIMLSQIKEQMLALYGDRLKGVVLYGSEARGEAGTESDVDVLVLLDGPLEFGYEIRRIISALYDLQLQVIRPLEVIPVDVSEYKAQKWPVFRNATAEGIPL